MIVRATGEALLDSVDKDLRQTEIVQEPLDTLFYGLKDLRNAMSTHEWHDFSARCLRHPIKRLLHQDPFTFRGFSKPRGYPGDAVLIDHIYQDEAVQKDLTAISDIGYKVYQYNIAAPAARAVRERRDIVARMIDRISDDIRGSSILSVACGHLNEAKHSNAVKDNCIGRFVALDQDPKSLEVVKNVFAGHKGIQCVHGTVLKLLKNAMDLGTFDFIYALGLLDYLRQPIAKRLTNNLFGMLRPGGRLLLANFVPDIKDIGYMEVFMDWKLINRNVEEMRAIGADIDASVAEKDIFFDKHQNIVFLSIEKNKGGLFR